MKVGVVLSRRLAFVVNVVMSQPGLAVDNVVFKSGRRGRRGRPRGRTVSIEDIEDIVVEGRKDCGPEQSNYTNV